MEDVIAFFSVPFPPDKHEQVTCMRLVTEHLATVGTAAGLEAVPFSCIGFGLFAPERSSNPAAPYIGVWFDDPLPLYWVQLRARQGGDGEVLACENCFGVEEVAAAVRELIPRLLALERVVNGGAEIGPEADRPPY